MNKQYSKKHAFSGFTLTEILITLAIIGIVAAITISSIITNIQTEQYKAAWKKAFSEASQAYQQAIIDNGGNGYGGYACGIPSYTKFSLLMTYLKPIKTCNSNSGGNCWAANGASYPDGSFPPVAGCGGFSQNTQINTDPGFITADGIRWLGYGAGGGCPIVLVDVNGAKGPDKLGIDVLELQIADKSLAPVTSSCGGTANSRSYLLE